VDFSNAAIDMDEIKDTHHHNLRGLTGGTETSRVGRFVLLAPNESTSIFPARRKRAYVA
jgi:hypothetical protein